MSDKMLNEVMLQSLPITMAERLLVYLPVGTVTLDPYSLFYNLETAQVPVRKGPPEGEVEMPVGYWGPGREDLVGAGCDEVRVPGPSFLSWPSARP